MNSEEWKKYSPYFSENENWGSSMMMKAHFLDEVLAFRKFIDEKLVVSCGTQGQHKSKLHAAGAAGDFVFRRKVPLLDMFIAATRFGFTEIGLNRDWEFEGVRCGGLHLGKSCMPVERKKYWVRIVTPNGYEDYGPTLENFTLLALI